MNRESFPRNTIEKLRKIHESLSSLPCYKEVKEERDNLKRQLESFKDRGGGRHGSGRKGKPTNGLKPEIICWRKERQWFLGVETPEKLLEEELNVTQESEPLPQDGSNKDRWLLQSISGKVFIAWEEDKAEIDLGRENYLLFKLAGKNQNEGRRVKSLSSGSYLVVVPENWQRDEERSGVPPFAPEPAFVPGYCAHFFILEKDSKRTIGFRIPEGKSVLIKPKTSQFELVGNRLREASQNISPLFGNEPPRIRALDARAWMDVGGIVIVEEGSGRGRQHWPLKLDPNSLEQRMPQVAVQESGWFSLRIYNTNAELEESMDFRFIKALKDITIHQPPFFPSLDGHMSIYVEFFHEPSCIIQPVDGLAEKVQIEKEYGKTILTVPADPTFDETHWLIGPADKPVEVTILVERIWWAVDEESKEPSQWTDKCISLSRRDFAATSNKAIWFQFPRQRWIKQVLAGFEPSKARSYDVKVNERTVTIPLRDFGDEVDQSKEEQQLLVQLDSKGEGIVIKVPLKYLCSFCNYTTSDKEQIISHFKELHSSELISPLDYEEIRRIYNKLLPPIYEAQGRGLLVRADELNNPISKKIQQIEGGKSLPDAIYKCSYCDFLVSSDEVIGSLTTAIVNHVERNCKKAREEARKEGEPVKLIFQVFNAVKDADVIRRHIIKWLPHFYRCKICKQIFQPDPSNEEMMTHLIEQHQEHLFKLI